MFYFDKEVCRFVQSVLDDLEAGNYKKPQPGEYWWSGWLYRWSDTDQMVWGICEFTGLLGSYLVLERGINSYRKIKVPLTRWERKLLTEAHYREVKKCKQMIRNFAREARN